MSLRALPIAFTLDRWVDLENTNCTDSAPDDVDVDIAKSEQLDALHVVVVALLFLGTAVVESGLPCRAPLSRTLVGRLETTIAPHFPTRNRGS